MCFLYYLACGMCNVMFFVWGNLRLFGSVCAHLLDVWLEGAGSNRRAAQALFHRGVTI